MAHRLYRRGHTYWAQLPVPPDVQRIFGKKNFQKTTRCKDKRNAGIQAATLIAGWQQKIDEARGNPDAVTQQILQQKALHRRDTEEGNWAFVEHDDDADRSKEAIHGKTGTGWTISELQVDEYLEELSEKISPSELEYYADIYHGRKGIPIGVFLDEWLDAEHSANKSRTRTEARKALKIGARWFPTTEDFTVSNRQVWMRWEQRNIGSVSKDVGYLRGFFKYLVEKHYITPAINPFDNVDYPKNLKARGELNRRHAEPAEIKQLLQLATDSGDDELARFILIGTFTGMRLAEIGVATQDSLEVVDGITCVRVKRNDKIFAKTGESIRRLVPLSSEIDKTLFPKKKPANDAAVGKRFGRLKSSQGFGKDFVFHSIRKTFATYCERTGVAENVAADLMGHDKKSSMTFGVYSGGSSTEQQKEAVEKVTEALLRKIEKDN